MPGNRSTFLCVSLLMAALFLAGFFTAHAALKDSDVDGITDEAETTIYRTDPQNHDTDGDDFDDGYEVTNKTNPTDAEDTPFETSIDPETGTKRTFWTRAFFGAISIGIIMSLGYIFVRREERSS